jgi:hypothetical protein
MIRFCGKDVSPAQQDTCPVAKKAVFKNCESNQSVIGLANANFGLKPGCGIAVLLHTKITRKNTGFSPTPELKYSAVLRPLTSRDYTRHV